MMEGRRMVMIIGPRGGVIRARFAGHRFRLRAQVPVQGRAARRLPRSAPPSSAPPSQPRAAPAPLAPPAPLRPAPHRRASPRLPPRLSLRPAAAARRGQAAGKQSLIPLIRTVICGRDEAPAQLVSGRGARRRGACDHRRRLSPRRLRRRRRRSVRSARGLPGAGLRRVHGAEAARRADRPERSGARSRAEGAGRRGRLPARERSRPRRARRRPSTRTSSRPSGGAILDLAPLAPGRRRARRSDQRHLPRRRRAPARRRPLRERRRSSIPSDPLGARRLRRGDLPRPPRGRFARHRRHPLRAAPLRAGRPRPQRSLQRRARSEHALPHRRVLLGRSTACAVRPRAGARLPRARPRSAAPRSAPGGNGRFSPRARRRRPTPRTRRSPAIVQRRPDSTARR